MHQHHTHLVVDHLEQRNIKARLLQLALNLYLVFWIARSLGEGVDESQARHLE